MTASDQYSWWQTGVIYQVFPHSLKDIPARVNPAELVVRPDEGSVVELGPS